MMVIMVVGVVAAVVEFITTTIYQRQANQHQLEGFESILKIRADGIVQELLQLQGAQALKLQQEKSFRQAFTKKDRENLHLWLQQSFNRYFATAHIVDLHNIVIYDKSLNQVAAAEADSTGTCSALLQAAAVRKGGERLKTLSTLCRGSQSSHFAVLAPIGGLRLQGYILVISNVAYKLKALESQLGAPVLIETMDHVVEYQSQDWRNTDDPNFLIAAVQLNDIKGVPVVRLKALMDQSALGRQLVQTRNMILGLVFASLILLLVLVYFWLKRTFQPLGQLQIASQKMIEGVFTRVETGAAQSELAMPILAFNKMVESLEEQTREKTQAEQLLKKEKEFSDITLASIINGVITFDAGGRIQYMNPKAEEIFGRSFDELRGLPVSRTLNLRSNDPFCGRPLELTRPAEFWRNRKMFQGHAFLHKENGEILELEYASTPMHDGTKVIGAVLIFQDVTQDRELRRQLAYEASHDALTGLVNRYEFERQLNTVLQGGGTGQHVLAFMDLDQFKVVNDTCGHEAGDMLLQQLTGQLRQSIRRGDTLARLGGDEFGIIFQNCDEEHALRIVGKIRDMVKQFRFVWDDKVFSVGVSVGLCCFSADTLSIPEILSQADTACYLAKSQGSNLIHVFRPEADNDSHALRGSMHWMSRLHKALENDRFELFVQPIEALRAPTIVRHYEVLLRYVDDDGGYISPGLFFPAAERYNLAADIDRWVIRHTLQWMEANEQEVMLSINLSGCSIYDSGLLAFIRQQFRETGVAAELVCFEITETAAVANMKKAQELISELQHDGCKFSLDDFGSGLSSFFYLRHLAVDYLKIDGQFVKDILSNPQDFAMVKAFNDVGHALNMKTIAEFVEHRMTRHALNEIGVDFAQGWAIGKPQAIANIGCRQFPQRLIG